MFRFLRRSAVSAEYRSPVMIENLEERRFLSADHLAAGLELNVSRHLTAVATQRVNIDLGVLGLNVPSGTMAIKVNWDRGKSAVHEDAFLLSNADGTRDVFAVNPVELGAGVHTMRLTMSVDAMVVATLLRQVQFLPRTTNGVALQATAGKPFSGTVGYLDTPLNSNELLSIDWGDGTVDPISSTRTTADNRNAVEGTHTYAHKGNYVISVMRGNVVGPFQKIAQYSDNVIVTTMHVRK